MRKCRDAEMSRCGIIKSLLRNNYPLMNIKINVSFFIKNKPQALYKTSTITQWACLFMTLDLYIRSSRIIKKYVLKTIEHRLITQLIKAYKKTFLMLINWNKKERRKKDQNVNGAAKIIKKVFIIAPALTHANVESPLHAAPILY